MTDTDRYLQFLRFALNPDRDRPDSLQGMDWDGLLKFADDHRIIGVMYYGLNRIPADVPFRPHRRKVALWVGLHEDLKKLNDKANRDAAYVTSFFYRKFGAKNCILKGQGNLSFYPDPYMRYPGDIDLWTDQDELTVARIAYSIYPDCKLDYHHVEVPGIVQTPLEVHFVPSFMVNIWREPRLQAYFRRVHDRQFKDFFTLPGNYKICVPDKDFNRIFQLSHLMHHFFGAGLGLRQVIDYYYLLRSGITDDERKQTMKVIDDLGLTKFAAGLMWVLHYVLGLDSKYLLTEPNQTVGKMFCREMLEAPYLKDKDGNHMFRGKGRWSFFAAETKRNLQFVSQFPAEALWGRPVARVFFAWHKYRLNRKLAKLKSAGQ